MSAVYNTFQPGVPDLLSTSDTGLRDDDTVTRNTSLTFTGTVPAGSFVRLYVDGVQKGTQQLGAGVTQYSITATGLTAGRRQVTVRVAENSTVPLAQMSMPSNPLSVTVDTIPPRIQQITIAGAGGTYHVPAGSGEQMRTVPVGAANALKPQFSEAMPLTDLQSFNNFKNNFAGIGLNLTGYSFANPTFDAATNTDSVALSAAIHPNGFTFQGSGNTHPKDQLVVRLLEGFTDVAGSSLDGEWSNPTSVSQGSSDTYPSGNGSAGGSFCFKVGWLPGDPIRTNLVDLVDFNVIKTFLGTGTTWTQGNMDGDANTDLDQWALFSANVGIDFQTWFNSTACGSSASVQLGDATGLRASVDLGLPTWDTIGPVRRAEIAAKLEAALRSFVRERLHSDTEYRDAFFRKDSDLFWELYGEPDEAVAEAGIVVGVPANTSDSNQPQPNLPPWDTLGPAAREELARRLEAELRLFVKRGLVEELDYRTAVYKNDPDLFWEMWGEPDEEILAWIDAIFPAAV